MHIQKNLPHQVIQQTSWYRNKHPIQSAMKQSEISSCQLILFGLQTTGRAEKYNSHLDWMLGRLFRRVVWFNFIFLIPPQSFSSVLLQKPFYKMCACLECFNNLHNPLNSMPPLSECDKVSILLRLCVCSVSLCPTMETLQHLVMSSLTLFFSKTKCQFLTSLLHSF